MTAVLEAAYLRQQLQQQHLMHLQESCSTCSSSSSGQHQQQDSSSSSRRGKVPVLQVDDLNVDVQDLGCSSSSLRKQAKREAEKNVDRFIKDLSAGGWQVKPFLLSTSEKSGFVKV